jgi:multidrug efflux system outer membrane protein
MWWESIVVLLMSAGLAGGGQQSSGQAAGATAAQPLRLRDAIAAALRNSPALRPADEAAMAADIRLQLARSAFGVKITPAFNSGSDTQGLARQDFGVGVSKRLPTGGNARLMVDSFRYAWTTGTQRDLGYAFSLSQPLLQGFGPAVTADLVAARRSTTAADRARQETAQQLVVAVAQAYFSVAMRQRLVQTAQLALERAAKLRAASEARMKVGLSTQLDVLRADLLKVETDAGLADQTEALAQALDQLKVLVGQPVETAIEIATDDLPGGPLAPAPGTATEHGEHAGADGLVAIALANRHDVLEARERIADAQLARRVAQWNLLPRLDLNVSYARRGIGSSPGLPFDSLLNGWRVNVATSYSVDRSAELAAASLAANAVESARLNVRELEQRDASEVRAAVRARARAAVSVAIQAKAVGVAEKQLRLSQLRYERGLAGNFDIVDAESNLFRAQSSLLAAEADRALASLVLERTLGTLDPAGFLH